MVNRPFTTSKNSHFRSEAKCKTSLVKRNFIFMGIKHHLQINCFALRLALKQRRQATFAKSSNSSFARGYPTKYIPWRYAAAETRKVHVLSLKLHLSLTPHSRVYTHFWEWIMAPVWRPLIHEWDLRTRPGPAEQGREVRHICVRCITQKEIRGRGGACAHLRRGAQVPKDSPLTQKSCAQFNILF